MHPDNFRLSVIKPMSINSQIKIAQINKKIVKWLPRLEDESSTVREEAGRILSLLALENPELRDSLIPVLIKKVASEDDWPVVCNGILFHLSEIPSEDPAWVSSLVPLYLDLVKRPPDIFGQFTVRDHAARYLWEMIESGLFKLDHPDMPKTISLARSMLEQGGGERLSFMKIIDWYEEQ